MEIVQVAKVILETGVLGAIIIAEAIVITFLYRENKELNNKRIGDLTQTRDAVISPMKKLQEVSEMIVKKLDQSNEILVTLLTKKQ